MNDRAVGTSGGLCSRSRRDPWAPGPGTAGAPLQRPLSRRGEKGGASPGGRGPPLPHVELRVCTVHGPVHPPYTRMIGTLVTAAQGEEPSQPRVRTEGTFSSKSGFPPELQSYRNHTNFFTIFSTSPVVFIFILHMLLNKQKSLSLSISLPLSFPFSSLCLLPFLPPSLLSLPVSNKYLFFSVC